MNRIYVRGIVAMGVMILISGCSNVELREEFMYSFQQGHYHEATVIIGGDSGTEYDRDDLLLTLYSASALRAAGRFQDSIEAFNAAEEQLIWKEDDRSLGADIAAVLVSETVTTYNGQIYEGTLINTFKALDYLQLGNIDAARVEFNRANERQKNAIIQLQAKIESLATDEEEQAKYSTQISQVQSKIGPQLEERLEAVRELGQYRDLRNPLTDWLHGIFRLATGDANKASDLLRNAVVLDDRHNPYLIQDFDEAEQRAGSLNNTRQSKVWVVFEDGIGPSFEEWREDLALPNLVGILPIHVGIALPQLVPGRSAYQTLIISAEGQSYPTSPLLNLDRLMATEFEAGYDALVNRVIASVVVKAVLQATSDVVAQAYDNPIFQLIAFVFQIGSRVYSIATTSADTRSWEALPHTVSIARLARPQSGQLRITTPDGQEEVIQLEGSPNADVLLFVKTVVSGAPIVYFITYFPETFQGDLAS